MTVTYAELLSRIDAALAKVRQIHMEQGRCDKDDCPICADIRKQALN